MATGKTTTETKAPRRGRPRGKVTPEALHAQRVRKVAYHVEAAAYGVSPKCISDSVASCGPLGGMVNKVSAWEQLLAAETFWQRYVPDDATAAAAIETARDAMARAGINSATVHFHCAARTVYYNWHGVCDQFRLELSKDEGSDRGERV